MAPELVEQFKRKYESLAGHVHFAQDMAEAADLVMAVLGEANGARLAVGELPEDLLQALAQRCAGSGATLLKPPFNGAELPGAIDAAHVGVTWAALALADAGTLVEFATDDAVRLVSTLPRVHVGLFREADLKATLLEAAGPVRAFFQSHPEHAAVTFISGPSRTADIEMRLTLGVHGPEAAHAVVVRMR